MESVFDPRRVRETLSSSQDYPSYPMAGVYEQIMRRTGADFSATVELLNHLPVFLEGAPHAEVRRRMALVLASQRRAMESAIQSEVEALVGRLFRPGRSIDLVKDFARPIWTAPMSRIVSAEDLQLAISVTTLFDPQASLLRRQAIDQKIGAFLCEASMERLNSLCLAALGYRPFVGSLALSVYETVARSPRIVLSQMSWADHLPVSAIRFLDRLDKNAPSEQEPSGYSRIRCHLHHSAFEGHANAAATFGHGAHVCLGKALTEWAWKSVCAAVRGVDLAVEAAAIELNPSEEPFYEPHSARILVSEAGK